MKSVNLWGYTIYEDGTILGVFGKKLSYSRQIKVKWGNKGSKRMVFYARFVYYAFHYRNFNFNDQTIVIKHINGDERDCSIANLIAIKRKDLIQGEKHTSAKLTNEEVEEIKKEYTRKEINENKNNPTTRVSYRKLARKYNVSHTMIKGIVDGHFRNKNNYIIK